MFEKVIKLFDSHFDKRGRRSMWWVFPNVHLRDLVHRRMLQKYPELNYVVYWYDANGYGLHMTVADWVEPGRVSFQA